MKNRCRDSAPDSGISTGLTAKQDEDNMADQIVNGNSIAPIRNVARMVKLVDQMMNRNPNLPSLATFFGFPGFGKSFGANFAANQFDAVYVEVRDYWTVKKFCQSILEELGVRPDRTIPDMADQISKELLLRNVPLLIDEADFLIKKSMIELVRGISEDSQVPVILIGEEEMPQKLQKWERVHSRILYQVAALPACMDDLEHLARIYCPEIDLAPTFKAELLAESHHSLRTLSTNLSKVNEMAMENDVDVIDLKTWGKSAFQAIAAPAPRRNLA